MLANVGLNSAIDGPIRYKMFTGIDIAEAISESQKGNCYNFNLADVVVGDGDDCGIDAIAILVNGMLITSQDEIDDLLEINRKLSEINFVFVQAKTSSNFDYSEMGTFGTGVKDFFADNPQMRRNDAIIEKTKL